jgi:hypothetical protein
VLVTVWLTVAVPALVSLTVDMPVAFTGRPRSLRSVAGRPATSGVSLLPVASGR